MNVNTTAGATTSASTQEATTMFSPSSQMGPATSENPKFNIHEYADQTIHTLQAESGKNFDIRLLSSLAGEDGVGFSMACVFIAGCVDQQNPRHEGRFVVKIFDPRHTGRLREEMKLPIFSDLKLGEVVAFYTEGKFGPFEEIMCATVPIPVGLSKRTMNRLPLRPFQPLIYGELFEKAIVDPKLSDELIAHGLMHEALNVEQELHHWLLCKHMFNNKASMHSYLGQFPCAPVVQLSELATIRPKLSYLNGTVSDAPFTFGTVIMELVDGCTLGELETAAEKLRHEEKPNLQEVPARMRGILQHFADISTQFADGLRRLFLFPLSVGIHSIVANSGNIMCCCTASGFKFLWIDIGQFQPHLERAIFLPSAFPHSPTTALARFFCRTDLKLEKNLYLHMTSIMCNFQGHSRIKWDSVERLMIARFGYLGGFWDNESRCCAFSWLAILEDICFAEYTQEKPVELDLHSTILCMARHVVGYDTDIWEIDPEKDRVKYPHVVKRLYYILCSEDAAGQVDSDAARAAEARFHRVVKNSGFDIPEPHVAVEVEKPPRLPPRIPDSSKWSNWDYDIDFDRGGSWDDGVCITTVLMNIAGTRIFPTRFWENNESYSTTDAIIAELQTRFQRAMAEDFPDVPDVSALSVADHG